ncbi:MAG: hypothetical protein SGPRY_009226, partial [Prymnesium sp.]
VTDELVGGFLPRTSSLTLLDVAHCTELTINSAIVIAARFARGTPALKVTSLHRLKADSCM